MAFLLFVRVSVCFVRVFVIMGGGIGKNREKKESVRGTKNT